MKKRKLISFIVILFLLVMPAISKPPDDSGTYGVPKGFRDYDNTTFIDANKLLMFDNNQGHFGYDITRFFGQKDGLYYPFVDTAMIRNGRLYRSCIYAAGVWMGGLVDGAIHLAVAEFTSEYTTGPMSDGTYQPDNPAFKVYKLYRDSLTDNPNDDYLNWPFDQGAPVTTSDNPLLLGEQTLWTVFNDADPEKHVVNAGTTEPLGIEIQQMVWAADEDGPIEIPCEYFIYADHVGGSDGEVYVEIVDTNLLTGHEYQVIFEPDPVFGSTWDLIDLTTGQILLDNQTNQDGDGAYQVVDGIKVIVFGGHLGVKEGDMYSDPDDSTKWGWYIPGGERRFTWEGGAGDWGFEGFNGAIGYISPCFVYGTEEMYVTPAELTEVLLVLATVDSSGDFDIDDPNVSYAYRYGRVFTSPPARPEFAPFIIDSTTGGYAYQDYTRSVPLSAWDVSGDMPRRLSFGHLENNTFYGLVDGKYWPPYYDADTATYGYSGNNIGPSGPREWLFIINEDYNEIPNPEYEEDLIESDIPVMYWITAARMDDVGWSPGGTGEDQFMIIPLKQYFNTPEDTFNFVAEAPPTLQTGNEGLSIYLKYKLYNKGGNIVEDFYFSVWTDPDLGNASDDLVGCDTLYDIWFCYNDHSDQHYKSTPPAVGYKLLKGLLSLSPDDTADFDGTPVPGYRNLGMTSFNMYINGTDPQNAVQAYYYMQGLTQDGSPLPNGTKYAYPGNPYHWYDDVDHYPIDKRMMASCGPITLNPGDSQFVLIKLAIGQGINYLSSVTKLKEALNNVPSYDNSILTAKVYPEPQYVLFAYAVDTIMDTVIMGRIDGSSLGDINRESILINESISPVSTAVLSSHADFNGEVIQIICPAADLLGCYGLIWDTTTYDFEISGSLVGFGEFETLNSVTVIGHRSGDVNDDEITNIMDITYILNYIYKNGPPPEPFMEAADVNNSRSINILDVSYLINYLYKNGPAPNCPTEKIW